MQKSNLEIPSEEIYDDEVPDTTTHPNTSTVPVIPQLSVALGLLFFVFGVTYIGISSSTAQLANDDVRVDTVVTQNTDTALSLASSFEDMQLQARSAFVWDVARQRVLFNKNADEQLPLASITKLMTALVTYELLDPKEKISISQRSLQAEGDSGFSDGEEFTIQNLIDLTLISSSNDGATALGARVGNAIDSELDPELVFVKAMNIKADELGLTKTYFKNSTGLDMSETHAGAYGSARDIALLMEYLITRITDAVALTNLGVTTIENEAGAYHIAKNTNESVQAMTGLIASKTGYTELSGGNLVVAVNVGLNRPIVIVVLGSTQEGRFSDTLELITRTQTYIGQDSI